MSRTLLAAAAALCTLLAAAATHAGPIDIGDDINARLARAKSQQVADAAARSRALLRKGDVTLIGAGAGAGGAAAGVLGNGCNIAIGNVFEDSRIGTSARRETTVIVTGDIIQVGNNCR
jgi:hypothetical protein